ncbi:MAG TPA: hypothetical protein VES89_08140, partial [Candidatus Competibacteraceae bacterium]|nr:hypothetical protein [Candidatus Competibacteraceae bacterium]
RVIDMGQVVVLAEFEHVVWQVQPLRHLSGDLDLTKIGISFRKAARMLPGVNETVTNGSAVETTAQANRPIVAQLGTKLFHY